MSIALILFPLWDKDTEKLYKIYRIYDNLHQINVTEFGVLSKKKKYLSS